MSTFDDSILRVMLRDFSQKELTDCLITTIKALCGDDKESLKRITNAIICQAHVNQITARTSTLEVHQNEQHRKELFRILLSHELLRKVDEAAADVFYEDYKKSGQPFAEWKKTLYSRH